jgi:dTDP-4-dehydrorhamnose 3,5-epimerase
VKATPLAIPDVVLLEPRVFADARGHFYESYNARSFAEAVGQEVTFVQDNHSLSQAGVVRGLHYQLAPAAQGKLVRVIAGEIFDVALDVRKSSPSCGKWVGERLSAANRKQLWIPAGFAHGFMALSDNTEVLYKATDFYSPAAERAVRWNDPQPDIAWQMFVEPILSDKDAIAPLLADAETFD